MKNTKQITNVFNKVLLLAISASLLITIKVSAVTKITSEHTYSSYAIELQKGDEVVIPAADMISYYNANETGYENSIEENAWFYKPSTTSISMSPLTSGAGCSVYMISDTNNIDRSMRIKGTDVGCVRMTGTFEWKDKLTGTPNTIKYYNFSSGIYIHMPAVGMNIVSSGVDDNGNVVPYYMYEGAKDGFSTNVLPYDSSFKTWDKISNNAIQVINVETSNATIANISSRDIHSWAQSSFTVEGKKEGTAKVTAIANCDKSIQREIQVNVFKKPTYLISATSLELAKGVTVADRVYAQISNLSANNKCEIKWTSLNTNLLEVTNDTTVKPTLKTKGVGKVMLKCVITDLVAKNNKSVSPTTFNVTVEIKGDDEISSKLITNNNSYIENGDTIASANEGDLFFLRVEESGEEAGYSCVSSNSQVCAVAKSSRSGYSFQLQKKGKGTATITVTTKSGVVIKFNYVGSDVVANVSDQYANNIIKKSIPTPKKPKISSVKVKKKKLYITIKKSASKYKAKGFQIKVKRNGKTIINCKWKKRKLRLSNIKKHSKYVIYIRTYNGSKKSKWTKVTKKIK